MQNDEDNGGDDLSEPLDLTEVEGPEDLGANPILPKDSWAHVDIVDVTRGKADKNGDGVLMFKFAILAGMTPDKHPIDPRFVGRNFTTRLSLSARGTAVRTRQSWAGALKLVSDADFGSTPVINWGKAKGQQVIVKLDVNEFEGQKSNQVTWGEMYALSHDKVRDVPINKKMAAAARMETSPGRAAAPPAKPAPRPAAPPAKPAAPPAKPAPKAKAPPPDDDDTV